MHGRRAAISANTRTRPLPQPSGPRGRPDTQARPYRTPLRWPATPRACGEPCGRPARRSHGRPSEAARSARLHRSTAARSAPVRWTPAPNPARTRDAPSRHLRSLNSRTLDGMNGHAHDFTCERLFHWLELAMRLLVVAVNTTSMTDQIAARRSRLLRLAPRSSGSPLHWVGSGPLPGRGQGTTANPPRRTGRPRPSNRTDASRPGHRGPANRVILERVTNMAMGNELDNITELEELALLGRGRPHRHLPAGLSRSAQVVASQRGGM
jgi:hypothetical protein